MKWSRVCLWFSALFFIATVLYSAGQFVYLNYGTPEAAPTVVLVHDFGTVSSGEKAQHVFQVTNAWSSPLVIDRISHECGCTTLGAELEGRSIGVGETIEVPVRWTAPDKEQEEDVTTRVAIFVADVADSEPSIIFLTMRARVKPAGTKRVQDDLRCAGF